MTLSFASPPASGKDGAEATMLAGGWQK